jgi:hypothetical protein
MQNGIELSVHRVIKEFVRHSPVQDARRLLGMQLVAIWQVKEGTQHPTTFSTVFVKH